MKYFSMFSGVGGFELGINKAWDIRQETRKQLQHLSSNGDKSNIDKSESWEQCSHPLCVGVCEIDKYASQLLSKRFEGVKNYGDATKIRTDELEDFDLLVGGFPCQAFSIAGKRRGFEDTRGTLFFEVARILKAKRPKNFVLENVKGLLSHNKGETFRVIIDTLTELGYDVQWMVLNSKFFGVPQNRERVFIIGSIRGTSRPEILPFTTSSQSFVEQSRGISQQIASTVFASQHKIARGMNLIGTWRTHKDGQGFRAMSEQISPTIPARAREDGSGQPVIKAVLTPDRAEKRQNGRRFKEEEEPSFTLTGQDIHGVMQDTKIRRLTPTECERLQGFPDNWTQGFSDTQRYKMMGNAVTVNVVQALMDKLFLEG